MKLVFHLPYELPIGRAAGSGVRPIAMRAAFRDAGLELIEIVGDSAARARAIAAHRADLDDPELLGVYSESATIPMALTDPDHWPRAPRMDAAFFRAARAKGIPVAMFYRDVHWRSERYRANVHWVKRLVAQAFYRLELAQLRSSVDVVFVPSVEMAAHVPELGGLRIEELPPGAVERPLPEPTVVTDRPLRYLYVGGVATHVYDIRPMLATFRAAPSASLTVCCREPEWQRFVAGTGEQVPPNVAVRHAAGPELDALYAAADAVCDLRRADEYLRLSMPVKLFEAIGHGKPVLTFAGTRIARFVTENDAGWVVDSVADAAAAVTRLDADRSSVLDAQRRARALASRHRWVDRAEQVVATFRDSRR